MNTARPTPDELLAQVQADDSQVSPRLAEDLLRLCGRRRQDVRDAGDRHTGPRRQVARWSSATSNRILVRRPRHSSADLEVLPAKTIDYRGVQLREFDVDAALNRRADLLLVDELAHTNAEGSRHAKRWQDVEELLAAGIDVWTTLNVQHIDSLNDVIGQVTGIVVRETIPDSIFESADELELVDLPPEDLLARLRAGKVYIPEQAQRAMQNFFQKSNLNALRELSLRQVARRIHTEVESDRRQKAVSQPWATAERLLVCVGPSPTTARVIRTAKRMATALDAPWLAVSVDLAGEAPRGSRRRRSLSISVWRSGWAARRSQSPAKTWRARFSITPGRATSPRSSSGRRTGPAGNGCCSVRSWTTCWRTAATLTST